MENLNNILKNKHILVVGKSENERTNFISELIKNLNLETFRFPKIKSFEDYLSAIKKKKLYKPWYHSKKYNDDAIWDFHRDWISENNSLLVIEEIQHLEKDWLYEIITLCINQTDHKKKNEQAIRLIISQDTEGNLIELLENFIELRENEKRTKAQLIQQNLKIIDIKKD